MAANLGERTTCTCCGSVLLICQNPDCRKPFPRGANEQPLKWGTRQYCSPQCAQVLRQQLRFDGPKVLAVKKCEHCGKEAVQRQSESPDTFARRKFCSRECGYESRRVASQARDAEVQEQRVLRQEARKAKERERAEARAETVREAVKPKPLIRKVAPVAPPAAPAPGVWRPAAWRALDEASR